MTHYTSPKAPTATEIFHLRSECAEIGEKLRLELHDSSIRYEDETHYDPATNRCFVAIRSWEGTLQDGVLTNPHLITTFLYDGQTKKMLAYYGRVGCLTQSDCKDTGRIFVDSAESSDAHQAEKFITKTMSDDYKH
jgi:hypothetical protein